MPRGKLKPADKLTMNDFLTIIPWTEIERVMGKRLYNKFNKWMRGQTCTTYGAYPCDVKNFLHLIQKGSELFWD